MSQFYNDSIFWIEVDKIHPNPYQPRREFDQAQLNSLAESIRQYGVLQPLVVTRKEIQRDDGSLFTEYELIAGERRLRASRLAGLVQVPVFIRSGEETDQMKLELAIIENIQREDLNPIDRAKAFQRLVDEFGFKHTQVAEKIGKSREYVSNSIRLLMLPEEMQTALGEGRISEGHTRPILMLNDRPEEQMVLYKEILLKKLTVREAEGIARRVAQDKVRKKEYEFDPELIEIEKELTERLGTRVQIERRDFGGKLVIDYFSNDDLRSILELMQSERAKALAQSPTPTASTESSPVVAVDANVAPAPSEPTSGTGTAPNTTPVEPVPETPSLPPEEAPVDDRAPVERAEDDDNDLYAIKNFSL